jgi:hypothetical protein
MEREYPDILNCEKVPHMIQFLPELFLYGELTLKVYSLFLLKLHALLQCERNIEAIKLNLFFF